MLASWPVASQLLRSIMMHSSSVTSSAAKHPLVRRPHLASSRSRGHRPTSSLRAIQIADHAVYLEEVAVTACPKRLPALLRVLQAQGESAASPSDRAALHPLVVPLTTTADGASVTGLLRWADPEAHRGMELPVVRTTRGGAAVELLARSVDELLHRRLAEEDEASGGGGGPLADAAGAEAADVYARGGVTAAGMSGKLALYLVRKAGMFPDVCEALARGHLERGDATSALVAAEWYMRAGHFAGWARPYEFACGLYLQLGKREEEARDMARFSLRNPWWSLSDYAAAAAAAQIAGPPEAVRYALSEEAAAEATGKVTGMRGYREARSERELGLAEAAKVLDLAAARGGGYDGAVAAALGDAYARAGLPEAADFVRAI